MYSYNGVSLIWLHKEPSTDNVMQTDAYLKGFGGICGDEYFRGRLPMDKHGTNIAILEIWAVMVALKLWANKLRGKYFWIHVDNEVVASVLNSGASQNPQLQDTLREIALISAESQFVIKARHIPGVDNRIPDWLSRWHKPMARKQFREWAKDSSLKHRKINHTFLQYKHKW